MSRNFELNYKLEPAGDIRENEDISGYEEFGEHSYERDRDRYEFHMGETEILLEYSKPTEEELLTGEDSLFGFNNQVDMSQFKSDIEFEEYRSAIDNIRLLEKIVLKKGDVSLDTSKILEKNKGKIYFNFHDNLGAYSSINVKNAKIVLTEDPLTPIGLMTLFHEIGHYQDYIKDEVDYNIRNEELEKFNLFTTLPVFNLEKESSEAVLKTERVAWAYALNGLRPFIKDLNLKLDGIRNFVHGRCLKSYSETIRTALRTNETLNELVSLEKELKKLEEENKKLDEEILELERKNKELDKKLGK